MSADDYAHVRNSFARQNLLSTFNAQLVQVESGLVRISAPIGKNALQQQGFAHAGLTFALGDSAAGYAALSLLSPADEVVTSEIKINLLAPGKGTYLTATGRVIKPGKRLIVVAADVHAFGPDTDPVHIAVLQGTMVPVPA